MSRWPMREIRRWLSGGMLVGILAVAYAPPYLEAANTYYVDAARPDDTGNGATWPTAKKTIQAAITLTGVGDLVLVTNGLYNLGGATNVTEGSGLTNRACVDKAITLQAVSANPADTCIVGAPDSSTGSNGPAAVRGVYLAGGATLIGFTVSNGYCKTWGVIAGGANKGGGVYAQLTTSIISNCVITMNTAYNGGGVFFNAAGNCYGSTISSNLANTGGGVQGVGTYNNCLIITNRAIGTGGGGSGAITYYTCQIIANYSGSLGGGLYTPTLAQDCWIIANKTTVVNTDGGGGYNGTYYNCHIISNSCTRNGGGLYAPTLAQDCEIRGNSTGTRGGGGYSGTYNRCQIIENTAGTQGGGVNGGTLDRCLILRNGGGGISACLTRNCLIISNTHWTINSPFSQSTATNCTIVHNAVTTPSAGVSAVDVGSKLINCIVYNNSPIDFKSTITYTVNYTCTPLTNSMFPDCVGNITNAPVFVGNGDFHLARGSPGIDAGMDLPGAITDDLDGRARPKDGGTGLGVLWDMGCYEYLPKGMIIGSY